MLSFCCLFFSLLSYSKSQAKRSAKVIPAVDGDDSESVELMARKQREIEPENKSEFVPLAD